MYCEALMTWYVSLDGEEAGPYTEDEFAELVETGTVDTGTLVWRQEMKEWMP